MKKHVDTLSDAIRKGISDADPEARAFSRKAFWGFAGHFREHADILLNSLDNSKQRMLHDELTMRNLPSSSSLTQSGKPYRSSVSNYAGSVENLSIGCTAGTLGLRTGMSSMSNFKPDPSSIAPLMAERTLQQSREAAVAIADALRAPTRRRYNAFGDQSDESETSSVCSDRSFSSFGRSVYRAPTRRRYNAFGDQSDESETSSVCSDRSFSSFGRSVDESALMFDRDSSEPPSEADNEIDGLLITNNHKTIYSIAELNQSSRNEKRIQALGRLLWFVKEHSSVISNEDFRIILQEVIQEVEDTSLSVKVQALKVLCELIRSKADYFQDYIELTLLKIFEAYKDKEREVRKMADICSTVAAINLPPDQSVRTLKDLIFLGQMPMNQAAIKMLTKLVEHHSKQVVLNLLPEIMPALIEAYDNSESVVRKAAVFCMVAIHMVVGEAMQPHLTGLNNSKMMLLNLYIKKAQSQNS